MNVIFIRPSSYYDQFCERLKSREINVLGIGDIGYASLLEKTKSSLTEYYRVDDLNDYEEVYRACAYFTWKYGKIDWIESLNENYLELEAILRTDFHVTTGIQICDFKHIQYHSYKREILKQACIPTLRYKRIVDYETTKEFAHDVGYPVIVKLDEGLHLDMIYELKNDNELNNFFATKDPHLKFIIEEKLPGQIEMIDGITDSQKNMLIVSRHVMPNIIISNAHKMTDVLLKSQKVQNTDVYHFSKEVIKAFDVRSRYVHCEFVRLSEDCKGYGKKGELVVLDIQVGSPRMYIIDMIDYEYDVDMYTIWADMIKYDRCFYDIHREYHVGYVGRRKELSYSHTYEEIRKQCGKYVILEVNVSKNHLLEMGNYGMILKTRSEEELYNNMHYILEKV